MTSRDLTLLFTALAAACETKVRARMAEAGHSEVRTVHGYVFQHLLTGPVRVTDLAGLLGMTPQGASKVAAEMERVGYVARRVSPDDQRARVIEITPYGREAVEAGRAARAAVTEELLGALEAPEEFLDGLTRLSDATGALRDLLARRLRPQ
ncbi:MarR family winged helix-turn-helix transcriptional regulator [Microbispora sp. ATCC PTA-5024]|uniref:MarR family winged helix-turn-helix transcriptional regulator n=1 Tax=Microbispora sp. ATCC PTA-5024 TaxID=316330 RepID=UPI0018DE0FFC|nr:MarR family winged helix-turn-helix transcriptional regulator [Microbispora sp. ATCC PTA-5024]